VSGRWYGYLIPPNTETYTFYLLADDYIALYLDNSLRRESGGNWSTYTVQLNAGQKYWIEVRFSEGGGWASTFLLWSTATISQ